MSARDELCNMIQGGLNNGVADYIADALISQGWRKPEQITTIEQLDALPVGSIVRGTHKKRGGVSIKEDGESSRPWASDGSRYAESSADVLNRLIAPEVIYTPGA